MVPKVRFSKEDIGGEILPILTTGLYRDSLDTLREYIQNAIDAGCQHIELIIDPDTITVSDDGHGMTFEDSKKAIKLGISEKSPLENVGFRGIGIYSAFNLCDSLDIYTRSAMEVHTYVIHLDFKGIREALLKERERAKEGKPSSLYLEKLLEDAVYVDIDRDNTVTEPGTRAIMSSLLGHVYQRLNNWDEVVSYLQNVVPLPFHPDFKYAPVIQDKFTQEDYRVVPVSLQIGNRRYPIYRPYYNEMFTHGGEHPPEFFDILAGSERFGFAWVCINDARRVLKDPSVRGLLIKKFGFSISDRNYLEPYFGRTVFNRRITGEIIAQHKNLLPNAARSDFEQNSTRQAFLQTLPQLIQAISEWANRIQEEDKAKEVLAEVSEKIAEINRTLPAIRRDRERLLELNIELHDLSRQIRPHAKVLKQIRPEDFVQADLLVKECKKFVKSSLVEQKKSQRGFEKRIIRSIQQEAALPPKPGAEVLKDVPTSLIGLIEAYGLAVSPELMTILRFLDENILQVWLSSEHYTEMVMALREFMEERL